MKKRFVSLFSLAVVLCFVLSAPRAFAAEIDFADKSWDEVIDEFLAEYHAEEGQVTIGYRNTVTGEEHFYDPDRYMVSGSMYKVPLTMVFAEKAAAGEIDLEKDKTAGYSYRFLMENALVNSNNDSAAALWRSLGSYREYRQIIAPIMGEAPDTVDEKYYENNFFTARQMLTCLKNLYADPDKYQVVIDLMGQAGQDEYFCRHEDRYKVAHKYGYWADDSQGILYLNDCGIVYTDEPYLLVCFTAGVELPYGVLSRLCKLMSDYTQYRYQARLDEQAATEAVVIFTGPEPGHSSIVKAVIPAVLLSLCAGMTVFTGHRSRRLKRKHFMLSVLRILTARYFCLCSLSAGF